MKVLYLYTEVMGYNIPIFEQLVQRYGATVDVVHWDQNKKTPYVPSANTQSIRFHPRSKFTPTSLCDFTTALHPDLVYTSGWQDKGYRTSLQKLKLAGVPIVMGLDSQWNNSLRQQLGSKLIKHLYKSRYFSYAWVPGPLQYECAVRFGFEHDEIVSNLLAGNTHIFSKAASALEQEKSDRYPKQFLYVGRFTESKGIDILIDAFKLYRQGSPTGWGLTCVGNGPLEHMLQQQSGITIEPFAEQIKLAALARKMGALILPSRYEPWGVVAHEFSTAGLPLLLSNSVGARQQLLIDGFNGYTFLADSVNALAIKMNQLASTPDDDLIAMANASCQLASTLNPEIVAASFVSVLERHQRTVITNISNNAFH
jgi:glycosyltransferase involved in cell wall biosynthesis